MAVSAAAIEIPDRIKQGWSRWMPTAVVTGIANPRHPHLQQLRVAGAMRFMAVNTVLHYGRVFPEKRPTSFGVATQAILIHCCLPKLAWIGSAVRVMATRAGYFAFPVRHVRGALQLRSAHLMTAQAKLRLGLSETFVF